MTSVLLNPNDRKLFRAAKISFAVSLLIMLIKFGGYYLTGSKAVLSDALESIVNVLASFAALVVMRMVAEPADEEHPYGHGKLEYFSAAFEGGLISFASLLIAAEALTALLQRKTVDRIDQGIVVIATAALGNLILGFFLRRQGSRLRSEAILASSAHVLSDVWTTLAAIAALAVISLTGWWWVDSSVAFLMAGYLAFNGYRIVRRSVGGLMDERDPQVVKEIGTILEKNRFPGLIDVHGLKVIRSGRFHHIDAHLVMPRFWDVQRAHQAGEKYEKNVVNAYPYEGEIAFHVDPCDAKYCRFCRLPDCPVREQAFEKEKSFASLELTKYPAQDHHRWLK